MCLAPPARYNQHCARQLANGNILLFDNGDARPADDDGDADDSGGGGAPFSRVVEYSLDFEAEVATLVWEVSSALPSISSSGDAASPDFLPPRNLFRHGFPSAPARL